MNNEKQMSLDFTNSEKEYLVQHFFKLCEQTPELWDNFTEKKKLLMLYAVTQGANTIKFVRHQEEGVHDDYLFQYKKDNDEFSCPFGEKLQVPFSDIFTSKHNEYVIIIDELIFRAKVKPGYAMAAGLSIFPFYKKDIEKVIDFAKNEIDKMLLNYQLEQNLDIKPQPPSRKI